jgi:rod shape-determining protein MreC
MLPTTRGPLSLLVILSVGHVLLISAQVQTGTGMPVLESVAFGAFARIQRATAATADAGSNLWTHYFALSGASRENDELKRQIVALESELQAALAQGGRVRLLEKTLAVREALPVPNVTARVIAGSPAPGSLTITIDRGSDDGVKRNMPVISAGGVVGRVIGTPSGRAALVQLLSGRSAAAGAKLEHSGAHGVVRGVSNDAPLVLDYLSQQVDVAVGEKVLTSGLDNVFPEGYLIGTVETADPPGLKRRITVRPAVDFSSLELVLVLLVEPPRVDGGGPTS